MSTQESDSVEPVGRQSAHTLWRALRWVLPIVLTVGAVWSVDATLYRLRAERADESARILAAARDLVVLGVGEARNTLDAAERSGVRTVAITMPLTTVAPAWKRWIKQVLGKTTDLELNAKRQRFNELLRQSGTAWPLIDLARLEATLEDGSSRTASFESRTLGILASEYTDDGAHLNDRGRRHVAPLFLQALSHAISGRD